MLLAPFTIHTAAIKRPFGVCDGKVESCTKSVAASDIRYFKLARAVSSIPSWLSKTVSSIPSWLSKTVSSIPSWLSKTVSSIPSWSSKTAGNSILTHHKSVK
ncbi:hypothetical protein BASA61_004804 [Batrachochytrium salamandrivorans]|nr:hypothetical protein BASA61_004804 [Batrachochytrium salamandrivorans]